MAIPPSPDTPGHSALRSLTSEVTDCVQSLAVPSLGFFFVTIRSVFPSIIVANRDEPAPLAAALGCNVWGLCLNQSTCRRLFASRVGPLAHRRDGPMLALTFRVPVCPPGETHSPRASGTPQRTLDIRQRFSLQAMMSRKNDWSNPNKIRCRPLAASRRPACPHSLGAAARAVTNYCPRTQTTAQGT